MCEHCRKSAKKEDVSMTYSYYRKDDGESESTSRVSPTMNKEEFRSCLSQMFLSMKIHSENIYQMTPEEFRDVLEEVQGNFQKHFSQVDLQAASMAKNPYLYN